MFTTVMVAEGKHHQGQNTQTTRQILVADMEVACKTWAEYRGLIQSKSACFGPGGDGHLALIVSQPDCGGHAQREWLSLPCNHCQQFETKK